MLHVLLALFLIVDPGQSTEERVVVRKFCTRVGAVWLEFRGDQVKGSYQVLIPSKRINGTIFNGIMQDHKLEAEWKDPDGGGQIIFFFRDDFTGFSCLYNNAQKPSHWYPVWEGQSAEGLTKDMASNWICEKQKL